MGRRVSYWPHTCASRSAQVTTVYVNGTYSSFYQGPPVDCACNPTTTSLDHSQNENTKVATAGGCVKEHFQEGAAEVVWCDTDVANGKWGVCGEIDGGLSEALATGQGQARLEASRARTCAPARRLPRWSRCAPLSLSPHGQTRVLLATHMRLPFFRAGDHRVCQRTEAEGRHVVRVQHMGQKRRKCS